MKFLHRVHFENHGYVGPRSGNASVHGRLWWRRSPSAIRGCPFARGGRVLVRFRANGDCLFARRSGEPLVRLRLTGEGNDVVLLYPASHGGGQPPGDFGAVAMPLDLALHSLSTNPYFLELRQTYG